MSLDSPSHTARLVRLSRTAPTAPRTSPVDAEALAAHPSSSRRRSRPRPTVWPLWASAAGVLGVAGGILFDARPPAEEASYQDGTDYTMAVSDVLTVDALTSRIGWMAGLLAVVALLVLQAAWRRHVEGRLPDSTAARVVSAGFLATAAGAILGFGWKGALANYLGPEAGMFDENGLFVYYMLTDFGAYLPWFGVTVAALAVAWMAFAERQVSRVFGAVSALAGLGIVAMMFVTGVPGIPGVLGPLWLALAGVWLAVGRHAVTARQAER